MDSTVGVTWNASGVYVSGISEQEFRDNWWPIIRFDYPKLRTQGNNGWPPVLRIHKLSGQDELVGKWIIEALVGEGWEPCDPPSPGAPVWSWGLWVKKPS